MLDKEDISVLPKIKTLFDLDNTFKDFPVFRLYRRIKSKEINQFPEQYLPASRNFSKHQQFKVATTSQFEIMQIFF